MIFTKKDYNDVVASRKKHNPKLKGWFLATALGQSRDDVGTLGLAK